MPPPVQVYHDADISPAPLAGAVVAVVGYGGQGRAQALNLRDAGLEVRVGLRRESARRAQALEDGWEPLDLADALAGADAAALLVPDEAAGRVFDAEVAPALKPGEVVIFAHGGPVTHGDVSPPSGVDVALVAPMGPGALLRSYFLEGRGLNAKVAVAQDASGQAWFKALAYGRALGCGRVGIFATTFTEETRLDLFSEQAVLCGGVPALAEAAFETLVEAGYPPALAYVECVREIKYVADLMFEAGIEGMRRRVSTAALYGGATRGPLIIGPEARAALRAVLRDVETGTFAKEMKARFPGRESFLAQIRHPALEEARTEFERLSAPPPPRDE